MVCIQWSNLEFQIAHAIWWMLNLDADSGKIVTGGLDMGPRVNMAINLARHIRVDRKVTQALETARAALQDGLDKRRNRAVHGVHLTTNDEGEAMVVLRPAGSVTMRIGGPAEIWCHYFMKRNDGAYYLQRALEEHDAARKSTVAAARRRHEQLAIAYELRCLLGAGAKAPNRLEAVSPAV
ncbi:MAG TPA: hypothetical protein VE820_08540 [Sphingomicrobium sp.]|jgi:hypothetical protein|nr:hypothetical protein [Sphingomicrobium sp.]